MGDCIFCKIAKKEIPAEIVYEDKNAIAFLDINPISPGHTMIIPKYHAPNLSWLPDEYIGPLFFAVKQVADKLQKALNPDGLSFGINQGRVTGQTIDHLHIHIAPRFVGDGGGSFHSIVHNPPKEDLKSIANKIRSAK
ncbi:MAG: HIT family protein [Candidatus Paceibacteria bacterium]